MYSNLDLLRIFVVGLLYVGIFKIQKNFTPLKYFSNADLVIQESISFWQVIIRYVLIAIFSISLNFLFEIDENIIIAGNILGAFLIVWPTLISPAFSYDSYISDKNKFLIFIVHIVFVLTTGLATCVSLALIPMFVEDFGDYVTNIIFGGGGLVFGDYVKRKLSTKIRINEKSDNDEYEEIIEED